MRYILLLVFHVMSLIIPSSQGRSSGEDIELLEFAHRSSTKSQPNDDAQIIEFLRPDRMRQCELRVDDRMAFFMHINNDNKIILDKLVCPQIRGGQHLAVEYSPETLSSDSHEEGLFNVRQHIINNINLTSEDETCNRAFQVISKLLRNSDAFNRLQPTTGKKTRHFSITLPDTTGELRNLNRDLCHHIYTCDYDKPKPKTSLQLFGYWNLIGMSDEVNRRVHCTFTPARQREAKGPIKLKRLTKLTIVGDKDDVKIDMNFSKEGERGPTDDAKFAELQEQMRKNINIANSDRFGNTPDNYLHICLLILGDINVNTRLDDETMSALKLVGGRGINKFLADIVLTRGAYVQGYNVM